MTRKTEKSLTELYQQCVEKVRDGARFEAFMERCCDPQYIAGGANTQELQAIFRSSQHVAQLFSIVSQNYCFVSRFITQLAAKEAFSDSSKGTGGLRQSMQFRLASLEAERLGVRALLRELLLEHSLQDNSARVLAASQALVSSQLLLESTAALLVSLNVEESASKAAEITTEAQRLLAAVLNANRTLPLGCTAPESIECIATNLGLNPT